MPNLHPAIETTGNTRPLVATDPRRFGLALPALMALISGCTAQNGSADAPLRAGSEEDGGSRAATDGSAGGTSGARKAGQDSGAMHPVAAVDAAGVDGDAAAGRDASPSADASGSVESGAIVGDGSTTSPVDAGSEGGSGSATPALHTIGRFDMSDPAAPRMGWPGAEIDAQFDGTGVSVTLSQADGYSGGPSWFDVVLDGTEGAPFSVSGSHVVTVLASGLSPGTHVVELQKRTEANLGVVTFQGFTFTGGSGLLAPPAPLPHRIEFLADSTIDGYGVLSTNADVCPSTDPASDNDSRSSVAWFTASASDAEMVLSAYSGKGLTANEDPTDTEYFEDIYPYALPDDDQTPWGFQTEVPDAVVFSLGGEDMNGGSTVPPGFVAAYEALVVTVRGHYPSAALWLTVWAQITGETATALAGALQTVVNDRKAAGDDNVFLYSFPAASETDQTGCEGHANVALSQAMGALLAAEIKQELGW